MEVPLATAQGGDEHVLRTSFLDLSPHSSSSQRDVLIPFEGKVVGLASPSLSPGEGLVLEWALFLGSAMLRALHNSVMNL